MRNLKTTVHKNKVKKRAGFLSHEFINNYKNNNEKLKIKDMRITDI